MDLKIKDIVDYLQVSEKTVYRWIKEKKIPCYRIHHQYRFSRAEINEWILSNKIELSSKALDLTLAKRPTNFADLLQKGGVHTGIEGRTVIEVLQNAIKSIPNPESIDPEQISSALVNREQMMSTAIGHGIAIPHPRTPLITNIEDASISVCYLQQPVDFGALDSQPVHTLFILLTFSPKRHLEVLAKISYLCQMEDFRALLEVQATQKELLAFVRDQEMKWHNKAAEN
ncbi:MAG TPA: PTS sugar transporter subunit IIA [bacterium]|jgi:PTS system nitrogen regulatory IIA component|nr:PTS sugar transporter subunit IIA [bacterium]HNT65979.1 PTS sugar transporter subunit IIA [bacterium]HOX86089.1 PTS sugar transporter subunit IIA [bacterium]HPG45697.1 PTS sugar transporter subunit IIA [bacterium]HPM97524.1 PTS sugar transporter subunit IIA [bacterium]